MQANRTPSALLIDDDPGSQLANQQRLEDDGYTVMLARDMGAGLRQARQLLPNAIFLHLVSGETGAVSFIQALRAEDSCRHIRVVVLRTPALSGGASKQLRAVPRDGW